MGTHIIKHGTQKMTLASKVKGQCHSGIALKSQCLENDWLQKVDFDMNPHMSISGEQNVTLTFSLKDQSHSAIG